MSILVTGGAGYIGSHTCVELLENGYDVVVVDNLCNSKEESLKRVEKITGKKVLFYQVDVRDKEELKKVFEENDIEAVIHFAGLKAVGESVEKPMEYYDYNVNGTLSLCEVMNQVGVKRIVFSSSATVYHAENSIPYVEGFRLGATSPYGRSKFMIEEIFRDICIADESWTAMLLRYFNPIGAHESGLIGEDPNGIPNNLMPYVTQVAVGIRNELTVFGDDYDTVDGTGVRDYIHVVDLAKGHLKAIEKSLEIKGAKEYNLGTGKGVSVLQLVSAFEKAAGLTIKYKIGPRRAGDLAEYYADSSRAKRELGWVAEKNIDDMCADSWNWQKNNPNGF